MTPLTWNWVEPPSDVEIAEGSNVRLDSDEWAEIILYNGARGVPVTTFISGGTTNKVQSPWIFNPEATDRLGDGSCTTIRTITHT